jgi:hypothetical protein
MEIRMTPAFTITFPQPGPFEAVNAAETWCRDHGISVGRPQAHAPRGLLYGDFDIQKWRNLSVTERAQLNGQMIGGRNGPVTIMLKHAPFAAEAR